MLGLMGFKLPESVLVVVHTAALEVLLLERARQPGFWQSVTGSREPGDPDLGARWFREKRCVSCHSVGRGGGRVGLSEEGLEGIAAHRRVSTSSRLRKRQARRARSSGDHE